MDAAAEADVSGTCRLSHHAKKTHNNQPTRVAVIHHHPEESTRVLKFGRGGPRFLVDVVDPPFYGGWTLMVNNPTEGLLVSWLVAKTFAGSRSRAAAAARIILSISLYLSLAPTNSTCCCCWRHGHHHPSGRPTPSSHTRTSLAPFFIFSSFFFFSFFSAV